MPTSSLPTSGSRIRRLDADVTQNPATPRSRLSLAEMDCLLSQVRHSLHDGGYPELRRISPQIQDSIVVLTGHVTTWHLKQMAQTVVRRLDGVSGVMNQLIVSQHSNTRL